MPALEAAEKLGLQIIWDLFHYGSPDCVDQASPDFPERFTDFAIAALELHQSISGRPPVVCPFNEINFLSWAVEEGYFPKVGPDEQGWFKRQLVRAGIMAARAIKQRWPEATIVWAEPLIHIAPHDTRRLTMRAAERNLQGMYEAYDWIIGGAEPELGGDPSLVDVVGLNFYPHNQWYFEGPTIPMGHHEYKPLADMLVDVAERYGKPVFIAETASRRFGPPGLAALCLRRGSSGGGPWDGRSRHLSVSGHRLPRLGRSPPLPGRPVLTGRFGREASRLRAARRGASSARGRSSAWMKSLQASVTRLRIAR